MVLMMYVKCRLGAWIEKMYTKEQGQSTTCSSMEALPLHWMWALLVCTCWLPLSHQLMIASAGGDWMLWYFCVYVIGCISTTLWLCTASSKSLSSQPSSLHIKISLCPLSKSPPPPYPHVPLTVSLFGSFKCFLMPVFSMLRAVERASVQT